MAKESDLNAVLILLQHSFVKIIYLLKEKVESTASKNYVTNFCKLLTIQCSLHETKHFNKKTNNKLNNENH